jgi:hypothetical protein
LIEPLGVNATLVRAANNAAAHELGLLQHPYVLGGRRKRHPERRRQLGEIALAVGKTPQHRAPRRMRQRVKDPVKRYRLIFNHVV